MKALTFKIEHGDWSVELQLPAEYDLDGLAYAILEAVGFECDHAYGFYDNLKNPYHSKQEYTLFATLGENAKPDDPGVEGTLIGTVFKPKKKLLFLYDYGDDWRFLVTCTGEANARAFKRPKLIAESGRPPTQYPDIDDED